MHPPPTLATLPNRLILVKKQVAIALRRFASRDLMESIGEAFGVAKQIVSDIVLQFIFLLI